MLAINARCEQTARRIAAELGVAATAAGGNDAVGERMVWREPRVHWRARQAQRTQIDHINLVRRE
jgi:hypothetical protein